MTTKETHSMAIRGLECLKQAVLEELQKKALLGQYAIINRDGKACRVPAKEALKIAEGK
ncbi:MAG: hypothetical protein J7M40_06475 [Planctomycetes bacterium]|nr:hypothetical protein [Planctomycetota bacterium]